MPGVYICRENETLGKLVNVFGSIQQPFFYGTMRIPYSIWYVNSKKSLVEWIIVHRNRNRDGTGKKYDLTIVDGFFSDVLLQR